MTTVTLENTDPKISKSHYRATAGKRESTGLTPGQALDSLLKAEGASVDTSTILIQRFVPDAYFTQMQHDRMQELLAHRETLTDQENEELDALIDSELDATVARTDQLLAHSKP